MRLRAAKTAREWAKSTDEFEARGGEPVFLDKDQAINYAQSRASFRCGEIRILDSSGDVERVIASTRHIENCDAIHPDKYWLPLREAYRAIAPPSARFDASANSPPVLRSLITNVLFSPSVDHGPRDTSLNSTKRQSVTSVSPNPR